MAVYDSIYQEPSIDARTEKLPLPPDDPRKGLPIKAATINMTFVEGYDPLAQYVITFVLFHFSNFFLHCSMLSLCV